HSSAALILFTLHISYFLSSFFFHDTPTSEIYTLSLHDALPISSCTSRATPSQPSNRLFQGRLVLTRTVSPWPATQGCRRPAKQRSEEHTSELQSRVDLVCRLLLEKKKK